MQRGIYFEKGEAAGGKVNMAMTTDDAFVRSRSPSSESHVADAGTSELALGRQTSTKTQTTPSGQTLAPQLPVSLWIEPKVGSHLASVAAFPSPLHSPIRHRQSRVCRMQAACVV